MRNSPHTTQNSHLPVKARLGQSAHAYIHRQKRARQWLLRKLLGAESLRSAGNEKCAQVRAAKHATGRALQRQIDRAHAPAIGRKTADAPAVGLVAPKAAFGVD